MSDDRKSNANKPNALIGEQSPYLLQHAYNPVNWLPWGEEAFEKATTEDKPIFLSIGYSTCHWCHVMAHESFEDEEVAQLMNKYFVSVKVDREERPDIDSIYMTVCQMLTGGGGWPLTIIMTPQKKPFFAGTYFPKHSIPGRVGMMELLPRVHQIWLTRRDEIEKSADSIAQALVQYSKVESSKKSPDEMVLQRGFHELNKRFDPVYGGFSPAPKFPTPSNFLFLLRYWKRTNDAPALEMVEKTLQNMRLGGIYEHVGFGFHRYSTDSKWMVPHFEKMLYDQALLALAYTEAFMATGKQEYRETAREVISYVLRDLKSPQGAFYSAEDADSEGEEGKFYTWTSDELREILGDVHLLLLSEISDIKEEGNFLEEATRERTGRNIIHLKEPLAKTASRMGIEPEKLLTQVKEIMEKLFNHRSRRTRPARDEKILTDWNSLMIVALAKAGRVFQDENYIRFAQSALGFILNNSLLKDGTLLHRYGAGRSKIVGNLDDYAFFTWALLELYESTLKSEYLDRATQIIAYTLKHFWDNENGGFFFTADHAEKIITRLKEYYDGAVPSGNSVFALNLLKLARITQDDSFKRKYEELLKSAYYQLNQNPIGNAFLMAVMEEAIAPEMKVVLRGKLNSPQMKAFREALSLLFKPGMTVIYDDTNNPESVPHALVCTQNSCKPPIEDVSELLRTIDKE